MHFTQRRKNYLHDNIMMKMLDLLFFHTKNYTEAKKILKKVIEYFDQEKHSEKFLTLYFAHKKKTNNNSDFFHGMKDFYRPYKWFFRGRDDIQKRIKNKKDAQIIIQIIPASYKSYIAFLKIKGIDLINNNYCITGTKEDEPVVIYWVYRKYDSLLPV